MKSLPSLLLALALLFPAVTATAEPAPDGYAACVACHGAAGEGNAALQAPALAGQDAAYLERQLVNYKRKVRGGDPRDTLGAQMGPMAARKSSARAKSRSTRIGNGLR